MTFGQSIRSCLSQYAGFRGRAARSEFWWFYLFVAICMVVAAILDHLLGTQIVRRDPFTGLARTLPYGWCYALAGLALLLPNLSVMVRRLHDTDRSGWWYWIVLVPIIGIILLIVWFCTRGTSGGNRFGTDPLSGGWR